MIIPHIRYLNTKKLYSLLDKDSKNEVDKFISWKVEKIVKGLEKGETYKTFNPISLSKNKDCSYSVCDGYNRIHVFLKKNIPKIKAEIQIIK